MALLAAQRLVCLSLVHWVAIAKFCMAAINIVSFAHARACECVCCISFCTVCV